MSFEWDRDKAERNRRKHGADFADAVSVLEDPSALTVEDKRETEGVIGHKGYGQLGSGSGGRLYVARGRREDDFRPAGYSVRA